MNPAQARVHDSGWRRSEELDPAGIEMLLQVLAAAAAQVLDDAPHAMSSLPHLATGSDTRRSCAGPSTRRRGRSDAADEP